MKRKLSIPELRLDADRVRGRAMVGCLFCCEWKSSTASAAGEAAQPGAPTGLSQIKVN